jgi:hypothetical protein
MSEVGGELVGRVVLGRYRILCLLARGGMGEVYLARSEGALGFHKPVVVKRVLAEHADNATIVGLFRREARVMSSLRHPNVVSVIDFGEDQGDHLMVIEYVHGFHLGRWMRFTEADGRFPIERAVQVTLEVLAALESAHTARGADGAPLGIVHRDVSPGNVLIDVEGSVKLADFGVARMQGEHTALDDNSVSLRGKFPYLSPELFDGTPASPASDTYAAAVLLDEMIRGGNVFHAPKVTDTMARVLKLVPPSLELGRPDVPVALAKVVRKAIAKKREDRFGSAEELAAALRAVRTVPADAAQRELAAAARADFLGEAMPAMLGKPPLAELEALWHGAAPVVSRPIKRRVSEDAETQQAPIARNDRSRRGRVSWALASALVIVLAGTVVYLVTRPAALDSSAPVVIVVDRGASRADAAVAAASDAGSAVIASADVVTPPSETPPPSDTTHRAPHVAPIEAPFRARASQISRCFTEHVSSVEGSPELVVHFDLGTDGSVVRASIAPVEIEPTALGQCLLGVARSTHFAPQESPVSFRVPLGARRVGG